MKYEIIRVLENKKIIIYKRLFNLQNCGGDLRYFEHSKKDNADTGRQFRSITQVKKYFNKQNYDN